MRFLAAFILSSAAVCGTAAASSFVSPPAETEAVSESMIALGEPAPPVTDETVAAIPDDEADPKPAFDAESMTIRGAIGEALLTRAAAAALAAAPDRPDDGSR